MSINVQNNVKGTLRAALGVGDNVLQLSPGGGAAFNFTAGNYCYIVLRDRSNYEIVSYTSTGSVSNDNITVIRGQDGTTAKAFPIGTCYDVAWNKEQLTDFVTQLVTDLFPTLPLPNNTQQVSGGTVPTLPPAEGIEYTVNITNGFLWYWNGTSWISISGSASGAVVTIGGAPPGTVTTPFWYDSGVAILYVNVSGTYVQVNAHRTSTFSGYKFTAGTLDVYGHTSARGGYHYYRRRRDATQSFSQGGSAVVTYNTTDTSFNDDTTLHPGALTASGANGITVAYQCVIVIYGQIELDNMNQYTRNAGYFTLTPTPAGINAIQAEAFYEPGGTDNSVRIMVTSPPILVSAGTVITMSCVDNANVHSNDILDASLTVEVRAWP